MSDQGDSTTVQRKILYLDLDGVLAQFVPAVCDVHGIDLSSLAPKWGAGNWNMEEVMGVSAEEFWRPINEKGYQFWYDIEPYPWAADILGAASELEREGRVDVFYLTTPSQDSQCAAAKIDWVVDKLHDGDRRFGRKVIIAPQKWPMAKKNAFLVDDGDHNIEAFQSSGGNTIIFPQRWNAASSLGPIPGCNEHPSLGMILEDIRGI